MYLVDTSAWIGYLRERDTAATRYFTGMLDRGEPFGITGAIYQEVLQGAASEADFGRLAEYLDTQRFYHPRASVLSYREAARLYLRCRRAGVTMRGTLDCLIAQVALEHGLLLVHDDGDFRDMARGVPELQVV